MESQECVIIQNDSGEIRKSTAAIDNGPHLYGGTPHQITQIAGLEMKSRKRKQTAGELTKHPNLAGAWPELGQVPPCIDDDLASQSEVRKPIIENEFLG